MKTRMEWKTLLCSHALADANSEATAARNSFVRDLDRIVFSAPFRRLANKTQVQPLYEHDHVHHRLIHSIEVSSVGRSLAMEVGKWLEGENEIEAGESSDLASIVQAACVAHDIGNPPFGHSGEEAIGDWFAKKFASPEGLFADVDDFRRREFIKFEGNAQGFRIITRLEMARNSGGLRLSTATLGAFTKYPTTAEVSQKLSEPYIGLKKFGIFHSELEIFEEVAKTLGLPKEADGENVWWARHPLVFLVEAADDICYNIVDLEDAFTTGELSYETVRDVFLEALGTNRGRERLSKTEHIALLRAMTIGKAVQSCVEAFKKNYEDIMNGTFSESLKYAGSMSSIFKKMKEISSDQVFTARRKTELEVSGRRTIENVMSGLLPVYEELAQTGWNTSSLSSHNEQLLRALSLDLHDVKSAYEALHSLADFVSGMTDRYALRISRMLSGT